MEKLPTEKLDYHEVMEFAKRKAREQGYGGRDIHVYAAGLLTTMVVQLLNGEPPERYRDEIVAARAPPSDPIN